MIEYIVEKKQTSGGWTWSEPKGKLIRCKDCKYFEPDHWEKVYRTPLIVAHEICTKWGDGCKTSIDGYCFLAERKEE